MRTKSNRKHAGKYDKKNKEINKNNNLKTKEVVTRKARGSRWFNPKQRFLYQRHRKKECFLLLLPFLPHKYFLSLSLSLSLPIRTYTRALFFSDSTLRTRVSEYCSDKPLFSVNFLFRCFIFCASFRRCRLRLWLLIITISILCLIHICSTVHSFIGFKFIPMCFDSMHLLLYNCIACFFLIFACCIAC